MTISASIHSRFISEEMKSLEGLVYQLFEFILVLKEKSRYKMIVKKAIDELCYYAILYMQITDSQVNENAGQLDLYVPFCSFIHPI